MDLIGFYDLEAYLLYNGPAS